MNLQEKIRQAQRNTAENIVIENLKANGLIKIDQAHENHSVEVNDMIEGKPERLNDYASRYAHLQDMPVVQPVERTAEKILRKHADNSSPVFSYKQVMNAMEEYASLRAQQAQGWISTKDRLPEEGGRYWCYIKEVNDLGLSHYQWNCSFNKLEKRWADENHNRPCVTHWRPLLEPPK